MAFPNSALESVRYYHQAKLNWPRFLPPLNWRGAAPTTEVSVHHGMLKNADENAQTFFVQCITRNETGEQTSEYFSPIIRLVELADCLRLDGFQSRHPHEVMDLGHLLMNPWVVLGLISYIETYRAEVKKIARQQGSKHVFHPLRFISLRVGSVLAGEVEKLTAA